MGETNTEYGADQIQILEGLEAVRKRPGMYIGRQLGDGNGSGRPVFWQYGAGGQQFAE